MAKLGYTWYPKDWGNSESVFELNLSERGLYRELIDLAMMCDNKTEVKLETWSRKFLVDIDVLKSILGKLSILGLIKIDGEKLFIPSCESRLNLVRGGSKGGKKSKPIVKPIAKPFESLDENNVKPIANQTKREIEIEINKEIFNELLVSESWLEVNAKNNRITIESTKTYLRKFNNQLIAQMDKKNNKTDYTSHFARWLTVEVEKEKSKPKSNKPLF